MRKTKNRLCNPFCLCFCSFVEKFSLKKAICMLLDKVDRQILAILQQDCTVSLNELAEA
ncbi:AsnC family protein, partial [Vibrio cholerae]|uniref:AsnC family protein n=1 Tax=Vibrio cholerae TaxID=666 RepID=UPI002015EE03